MREGDSSARVPPDAVPITVRLHRDQVSRIDEWRAKQPEQCSRQEAIRRLVEIGAHCEPYVQRLLVHLEQAAAADHQDIEETVTALRAALGAAEGELGSGGSR
jgi:hypothetical protein